MDHARFSAPRPLRSSRPETTDADRPAGQQQVDEERHQREAERPQIEAEEDDREQRHRHHADRQPDDAHDHQRGDEFHRPQRGHHQVAQVARIHLLEKRDREAELAAEQDVPQHHRADERAGGAARRSWNAARCRPAGSPTSASAPSASRSDRACAATTTQQIPIAQHHRARSRRGENATYAGRSALLIAPPRRASPRPRATSRNTSSRLVRP